MNNTKRRVNRAALLLTAAGLAIVLVLMGAGAALAGGGNSSSAKQCADWASLYKENGSKFVNRGDCVSYAARGGIILTTPPPPPPDPLLFRVVVDSPSPAAGTYEAAGAEFGPEPTDVTGSLILVNDGTAAPSQGCSPLVGFPGGAIALVDRGGCDEIIKVANAQAAGAIAVVVVNDVPGDPEIMEGTGYVITIPSLMVAQDDGAVIKAGLPATGSVTTAP